MFVDRAHKRFKIITVITAVVNFGVMLFMLALGISAKASGASGLEFLALLVMPVVFLGYALALFYVFYYPYYLLKYRQKNGYTFLGAAIFIIVLISISLNFYSSNKSANEEAASNRILTTSEAKSLLETCNVKSVDEGTGRFQATMGDVTYIRLHSPVPTEGNTLERYASYQDFNELQEIAKGLAAKCGDIDTYSYEETKLDKNKSFEYAR